MSEPKPFLLKIILEDISDEQKNQINLLFNSITVTLFLVSINLSYIIMYKICNLISTSYNLLINKTSNYESIYD